MYSSASLWRFCSLVVPPQHFKCEDVKSVGTPIEVLGLNHHGEASVDAENDSPNGHVLATIKS